MSDDSIKNPQAFSCQRCGHCCKGGGGIIMTSTDRTRLAAHLGLSEDEMLARYAESQGDKMRLKSNGDGWCVFYEEGCSIHPARPDICRAWPFFRGNIVDRVSWEMAQDYCPGINAKAGHKAFVRQGLDYLSGLDSFGDEAGDAPTALRVSDVLREGRRP